MRSRNIPKRRNPVKRREGTGNAVVMAIFALAIGACFLMQLGKRPSGDPTLRSGRLPVARRSELKRRILAKLEARTGNTVLIILCLLLVIALIFLGQIHEYYRGVAQFVALNQWSIGAILTASCLLFPPTVASFTIAAVSLVGSAAKATPSRWKLLIAYGLYSAPVIAMLIGLALASTVFANASSEAREEAALVLQAALADPNGEASLPTRTREGAQWQIAHDLMDTAPFVLLSALVTLGGLFGAFLFSVYARTNATRHLASVAPPKRCMIAVLGFVVVTSVFAVAPVSAPRALGPFFVLSLAFMFYATIFQAASQIRIWRGLRLSTALIIAAAIFAGAGANYNHLIESVEAPQSSTEPNVAPSLDDAFDHWWQTRRDKEVFRARGKPYPVFVFVAQGGGIYAAAHSASLLRALHMQCGAFPHHLFGTIGVSGGSVGTALYRAAVSLEQKTAETSKGADSIDKSLQRGACEQPAPLTFVTAFLPQILSEDYLSPVLASLLFPDFLQRFLPVTVPSFDRARSLSASFVSSWEEARIRHAEFNRVAVQEQANELAAPYASAAAPRDGPYAFAALFNTTEIETGSRRVIAPFRFQMASGTFFPDRQACWLGGEHSTQASSPSLIYSAVLSARFPYVTPAGEMQIESAERCPGERAPFKRRLVDGGYFENSGASTAQEVVSGLMAAARRKGVEQPIQVHVIATATLASAGNDLFAASEILGPPNAVYAAGRARGDYELKRLTEFYERTREYEPEGVSGDLSIVVLDLKAFPLPLGWSLSPATRLLIEAQAANPRWCGAIGLGPQRWIAQRRIGELDGNCALMSIMEHLR